MGFRGCRPDRLSIRGVHDLVNARAINNVARNGLYSEARWLRWRGQHISRAVDNGAALVHQGITIVVIDKEPIVIDPACRAAAHRDDRYAIANNRGFRLLVQALHHDGDV